MYVLLSSDVWGEHNVSILLSSDVWGEQDVSILLSSDSHGGLPAAGHLLVLATSLQAIQVSMSRSMV